jgi:hypothetical protein
MSTTSRLAPPHALTMSVSRWLAGALVAEWERAMPPTPARPWWNCGGEGAVMEVPEEGVCVRM